MPQSPTHTVYLVSDGTCRTCEQMVRSVLVQFDQVNVQLVRKANVRRAATVEGLVEQAARDNAVVFYTLIEAEARSAIEKASVEHSVPVVDLLGPVLSNLHGLFRIEPTAKPGVLYQTNRAHYDRMDAVEYTLAHDDGRHPQGLSEADVVLVGVSRSSKSTTCFYLAYSGVRAANVPLFPDREPPAELLAVDPRRVIGLMINPHRLESVRAARLREWNMDLHDVYGQSRTIAHELRTANDQMTQHGWRSINVSYKAIEETAREILRLLDEAGVTIGEREPPPDK